MRATGEYICYAGVHGFHTVPVETLRSQIDRVLADIGADVVKTGMLPSAEVSVPTMHKPCNCRKQDGREPLIWIFIGHRARAKHARQWQSGVIL